MKIFICFVILFSTGHCIYSAYYSYGLEYVNGGVHQYGSQYNDNYNDRSNNTNPIIYPCALHDIHCIRGVFARNSRCIRVEGPTPDPYILKQLFVDIPHANLTLILNDAPIQGLHKWRIEEFYINKATDRLVLEVVFDNIIVSSPRTMLRFYRKGKEPIEVSDVGTIEYGNVSLTLTIPHVKDIQLSRGHVYTYLSDVTGPFALGPGLFSSKDPVAVSDLTILTINQSVTRREVFATQGPVFMSIFLQSTICNFGYH